MLLRLAIDTSQFSQPTSSLTKFDLGSRAKPLLVVVDGVTRIEGDGWTFSNGILTVTGAKGEIKIGW